MEFHWQPVWVSRGRFVATQLQQIMAAVAERVHDDEPAGDVRVVPTAEAVLAALLPVWRTTRKWLNRKTVELWRHKQEFFSGF